MGQLAVRRAEDRHTLRGHTVRRLLHRVLEAPSAGDLGRGGREHDLGHGDLVAGDEAGISPLSQNALPNAPD